MSSLRERLNHETPINEKCHVMCSRRCLARERLIGAHAALEAAIAALEAGGKGIPDSWPEMQAVRALHAEVSK